MTLRVPETSPQAVDAIQRRLAELAGRPEFRRRALATADIGQVSLAAPHDVYTLGLDRIVAGGSLDEAQPVGRRFLVMDDARAIAAAEVAGDDGSGFSSNEGRFVAATADAIRHAEQDPELADGRYELRLLRIPAIYLMALWLKDDDGGDGVVIPLEPAPPPLQAGRRYGPDELLRSLAGLAEQRLAMPDDAG